MNQEPRVFVVTLEAQEAGQPPALTVLAFARADSEAEAHEVAIAELEGLGWTAIQARRCGEITDPEALPPDFAAAMATALIWGCGLIVYDEP